MTLLAQTTTYGSEYSVYDFASEPQTFKVVRKNLRTQKEDVAYFNNKMTVSWLDDEAVNNALSECKDRNMLISILTLHRAHQRVVRNLFATSKPKTSHSERKRPQTKR